MIADLSPLTDTFMHRHPSVAARVLAAMPSSELVTFFARTPADSVANVIVAMPPIVAARSLTAMAPESAAKLLAALPARTAAAALRYIEESRRAQLLRELPAAQTIAIRLLLGFPDELLGSWADPDAFAVPAHTPVDDVLEQVRASPAEVGEVLVVEGERRLLGHIGLAALLRAPGRTRVGALVAPVRFVLDAQATLADALAHPGWDSDSVLPVVDRAGGLIGTITRATVRAALREFESVAEDALAESLTGIVAQGYWAMFSGILDGAASLLPTGPARGSGA